MPVAEWLPSYGTDPYYPSRRIRRITERVYFKVMGLFVQTCVHVGFCFASWWR